MILQPAGLLFRLLVLVIVLAPLPLGANRPWAWSLLALLTGLMLAGWTALAALGTAGPTVPLRRVLWIVVPFSLACLWGLAQAMPWLPAAWSHPLWGEAGAALGGPVPGFVSIDPALTGAALLRLATYAGLFWLALQLGRERGHARLGLVAIACAGIAYAAYGLVVHLAGWERILWLEKWAYRGDLTATFVNRNAYGAYAGIGLVCCLGLGVHRMRRQEGTRGARDLAERLLLRAAPWFAAAILLAVALMLTHSRGALLATGLAVLALFACLALARMVSRRAALALGIGILAIGTLVVASSGEATLERLAGTSDLEGDRGQLYRLSAVAIGDAPLLGHGLGTFAAAFKPYRDASLPRPVLYDFAHDIPLELAMDLGLPAALLLQVAYAAGVVLCVLAMRRRRRGQIYPAVGASAALLLFAHGLVDFSAQMPAIAATLAVLLGIGCAQSWSSQE